MLLLGLKKYMFVSCHPTVPRNGPDPSNFFLFYKNHPKNTVFTIFNNFLLLLLKGNFWTKLEENPVGKKKMVKHWENSVFGVIFVKKNKKIARVGTISRDGRMTGNKHILFRP